MLEEARQRFIVLVYGVCCGMAMRCKGMSKEFGMFFGVSELLSCDNDMPYLSMIFGIH